MNDTNLRKSRYCFLVKDKDNFFAYSSSKNGFHVISQYVYDLISEINVPISEVEKQYDAEEIKTLRKLGLLTTTEEDDSVVEKLRFRYLLSSYSTQVLTLTILPTLSCNLKCPYCFEENKPMKQMDEETCNQLVNFIKKHTDVKTLNITRFGGEPLVGVKVIENLLNKIDALKDTKLGNHSIITNGTLLNEKTWNIFKEHPLNDIQITLDGKKETHDTKRIRHDGTATYDTILTNLDSFVKEFPNTQVSIRVNIDKNNSQDFMVVYDQIKQRYPDKKNIIVYPGILRSCGRLNAATFLTNKDLLGIYEEFYQKGYPVYVPFTNCSCCSATGLYSYVIGPDGEIYKCWEDVGIHDKVVGFIDGKPAVASDLLTRYMIRGSHILDPECENCPLLPVCSNDCAHDRLLAYDNKFNTEELCSLYKTNDYEGLNNVLLNYFHAYSTKHPKQ